MSKSVTKFKSGVPQEPPATESLVRKFLRYTWTAVYWSMCLWFVIMIITEPLRPNEQWGQCVDEFSNRYGPEQGARLEYKCGHHQNPVQCCQNALDMWTEFNEWHDFQEEVKACVTSRREVFQ